VDTSTFFMYPTSSEPATPSAGFLAELDQAAWDTLLSHMQTRHLRAREVVLNEGEPDRALYLLTVGRVELTSSHEPAITLAAPATFNEVSFFDGGPSTISVRAGCDGELLRLSYDGFESLAAREPGLARTILLDLGRLLAARLRSAPG
jgi:CRP-like cAMP-binding protein